jgi:outer membrane phospholipase A
MAKSTGLERASRGAGLATTTALAIAITVVLALATAVPSRAASGPPAGRLHELPPAEPTEPVAGMEPGVPVDAGAEAGADGGFARHGEDDGSAVASGAPREPGQQQPSVASQSLSAPESAPTQPRPSARHASPPAPPAPAAAPPAAAVARPPTSPSPPGSTAGSTRVTEPAPRVELPTIQRPEQPITATPPPTTVPAAALNPEKPLALEYVPGYRYILSGHKENYFITGVSESQHLVKFQYSVKFDLWPNASRHSAYFGFTQKSLWNLFTASSPFLESNYAPELFYGYYTRIGDLIPRRHVITPFIDNARVGLEHESNGLDNASSRSWNRVSGTARAGAYLGTDHYVIVAPKAWVPMGLTDNPDIAQFLGYGSLSVEYGYDPAITQWYGGGNLKVTGSKGANLDWTRGAVEVTAQWRPGYEGALLEWWKFTPYFYAQLFTGYGETLLRYNEKFTAFRIGFALEDRVNWVTLPKRR